MLLKFGQQAPVVDLEAQGLRRGVIIRAIDEKGNLDRSSQKFLVHFVNRCRMDRSSLCVRGSFDRYLSMRAQLRR